MKMAFLVICPGSFQYDGERERQRFGLGKKKTAEEVLRRKGGERRTRQARNGQEEELS